MPDAVYLIGAGGHGRVVLDALRCMGVSLAGILDPGLLVGEKVLGVPVLGGDDVAATLDPAACLLVNGVGAVARRKARVAVFERLRQSGFRFLAVRHPSAAVSLDATLADGSQVMAGAVVQVGAGVGENAIVNTSASVDHDSIIGAHAFVGPACVICGEVVLGEGAFVGAGAVVLPGVRIGAGAIVAAGAIVTRDVADGGLVMGNPARAPQARERISESRPA